MSATNMLAVPVLLYSFGVVKWTVDELRKIDRDNRKMMHMQRPFPVCISHDIEEAGTSYFGVHASQSGPGISIEDP